MTKLIKANPKEIANNDQDQVYDFPLFSKIYSAKLSSSAPRNLQRIFLRSPSPNNSDPGFLVPQRPDAYYFTQPASKERLAQYREAAVTGEEVLKGLQQKWPGFAFLWRLRTIHIPHPENPTTTTTKTTTTTNPTNKPRTGKKRRIAIRQHLAARSRIESVARRSQAEKEAAWKEKQARKNRTKKVKRREKKRLGTMTIAANTAANNPSSEPSL